MPLERRTLRDLTLADERATADWAAKIAAIVAPGDVIALDGTLGAGKTAFARAFVNALPGGIEDVPSPTFTLVQTYERGDLEVWHFDLYRIEDPEDAFELGIEDAFADGVSLIEWPDRLGPYLPARHLSLNLAPTGTEGERRLTMTGEEDWSTRLAPLFDKEPAHG